MKLPILVLTAASMVGVASAQTTGGGVAPPSQEEMQAAMTTPQAFVERAASSNMFEILSSQLALQMALSDEVRAFAEQMIADHQMAGERMMAAATAEGLVPSDRLMPDHQAQLDSLATSTPQDFDAAYLGAQVAAHTEGVLLFQGYSSQGPQGPLKDFATETLPTLQQHLDQVAPMAEI